MSLRVVFHGGFPRGRPTSKLLLVFGEGWDEERICLCWIKPWHCIGHLWGHTGSWGPSRPTVGVRGSIQPFSAPFYTFVIRQTPKLAPLSILEEPHELPRVRKAELPRCFWREVHSAQQPGKNDCSNPLQVGPARRIVQGRKGDNDPTAFHSLHPLPWAPERHKPPKFA